MASSPLQQRPYDVLLPLAGARVQNEARGEIVEVITIAGLPASTGGDHWLVSSSEEGGVILPPGWQGGRGAAAGRWEYFS